jgi:predicted DsbA family dithiol-disulfide isomerase
VELLDPHGEYLTHAWRDHIYPLAAKMNLPMKMPPLQPRSRLAHEAAKWAGSELGLDPAALAQALESHQFKVKVLEDEEEAQRLGIRAVPSFVANGRVLASGVQTAERLRELLASGPGLSLF